MVEAFGYTKMMALLKENKGSSVWNFLNIDDLVNSIFAVKNHENSWVCAFDVKGMSREEQDKCAAHKTLGTPEERMKYAPITTEFNRNTKREFGMSMMSEEGHKFYVIAKKNWQIALTKKKQVDWIEETWYK